MSVKSKSVHSDSMAIVPYKPLQSSKEFLQSQLERVTNEVFRRSLEQVKYATNIFPQISSNFTGPKFFQITTTSLTPPRVLKTDSSIEVEIFTSTPNDPKSPILIFSHGWEEPSRNYRVFLGELASHGYTVLSLNHPSSLEKEPPGLSPKEEVALTEKLADIMVNNIQYVVGQVRRGLFNNFGDPNKIILAGHSLGGAASVNVSRIDPAISGCINLDGALKGKSKTDELIQPLLIMMGDYEESTRKLENDPNEVAREYGKLSREYLEESEILSRKSPHSEKIVIPGAMHMDFSDKPFKDYLAGEKSLVTAMRVHTIVSSKVLEFLRLCSSK